MKFRIIATLIAFAPLSAEATTIQAVYTGTVGFGYDEGWFLDGSSVLEGQSYVLVYTYDTARGTLVSSSTSEGLFSGSSQGKGVAMRAKLTINGVTQIVSGAYQGSAQQCVSSDPDCAGGYAFHVVEDPLTDSSGGYAPGRFIQQFVPGSETLAGFSFPAVLSQPYSVALVPDPANFLTSYFSFNSDDPSGAPGIGAFGSLLADSLTVSIVAAVPLPAPGLLLLATFGGLALFRRSAVRPAGASGKEN